MVSGAIRASSGSTGAAASVPGLAAASEAS